MIAPEKLLETAKQLEPQLREWRRTLHRHPEVGFDLPQTKALVKKALTEMGYAPQDCGKCGVLALAGGKKPGKVILLRGDMDALPLQEDRDRSYCSKNDGVMHACGHDVHMTVLLGVAKLCKEMQAELPGTVKLFFQPAEETVGGGERMVQQGCCENPKVDYSIGLHVQPYMDAGNVELRYGQLNASCDTVTIVVHGKAGHGAYPERGVDAIVAAAGIVSGLQTFVSRNISPLNNAVLTIGTIQGGAKSNIVADQVKMTGTLRTLDPETRVFARDRITAIAQGIAQGYGCTADVDVEWGYAALINTDAVVDVMKECAEEMLGREHVLMKQFPSLGGEDFSYFIDGSAHGGAFYHLGCGNSAKGITAALHNQQFDVDEGCIPVGIALQMKILLKLLTREEK